jgi:hypothetical protein
MLPRRAASFLMYTKNAIGVYRRHGCCNELYRRHGCGANGYWVKDESDKNVTVTEAPRHHSDVNFN